MTLFVWFNSGGHVWRHLPQLQWCDLQPGFPEWLQKHWRVHMDHRGWPWRHHLTGLHWLPDGEQVRLLRGGGIRTAVNMVSVKALFLLWTSIPLKLLQSLSLSVGQRCCSVMFAQIPFLQRSFIRRDGSGILRACFLCFIQSQVAKITIYKFSKRFCSVLFSVLLPGMLWK